MMEKKRIATLMLGSILLSALSTGESYGQEKRMKDAYAGKFYIGTALNQGQITGRDTASIRVVKENFSAIVAENCMKIESIQPQEGVFDFDLADQFVEFGEKNGLFITGHTLMWHSQVPAWFFKDSQGNEVTREVLIERMKKHITTLVTRYKGRVKGWDVVNEAIEDDGSYRKSRFFKILGEDFIKLAFQFAHEADPSVELYYNDYSMANAGKRKGVVAMVKMLKDAGLRIDAVGMQCHIGLDYPSLTEFEASMEAFAAAGVKVMITEMDLTVLPTPNQRVGADVSANFEYQQKQNPYAKGLPDSVNVIFEKRYSDFFNLFLKHDEYVTRVTVWGVNDEMSWRNGWPVRGRTDYPLLFDRANKPKPVVSKLIKLAANYSK